MAAPEPPSTPTPLQEVAAVFAESSDTQARVAVEPVVEKACDKLNEAAQEVIASLQAEAFPTEAPLKDPQEVLEGLLAKSASHKKDVGYGQAEAALQTTQAVIATMRNGDTDPNDEL